jgi:NAD(P)-dependent dehydrogenase (short-subunit alcohol dehydrogenase family)
MNTLTNTHTAGHAAVNANASPKTVVITGASSGIGFALAQAYLRRGDNVVGNGRTLARLQGAADKLGNPDNFLPVAGDVASPAIAAAIFARAIERFGKVDVLINNAGIFIAKPVADYSEEDVENIVSTNLKGFFYITQQAARHMSANRQGHIVNITASIAMQPTLSVPALLPVLIKGGLNQATRALALELAAHNVRVNAVAPGIIDTPMHTPQAHDFLRTLQPSGRIGESRDVVDAVLYLTDSRHTSGAVLPVDGGATAGSW